MGAPNVTRRSYLVDFLIVLFGVSSWVAVNGLWVELPVLVKKLPESWKLASYIVITTQIANLGPIIFSAARKKWSQKVSLDLIFKIYFIGLVGIQHVPSSRPIKRKFYDKPGFSFTFHTYRFKTTLLLFLYLFLY